MIYIYILWNLLVYVALYTGLIILVGSRRIEYENLPKPLTTKIMDYLLARRIRSRLYNEEEILKSLKRDAKWISKLALGESAIYLLVIINWFLFPHEIIYFVIGIKGQKKERPVLEASKRLLINKARNLLDKLKKMHHQMHEYVTNLIVPQELDWKAIDRLDEVPMVERLQRDQDQRRKQSIAVPVNKNGEKFGGEYNKWYHLLRINRAEGKISNRSMYEVHRELRMPFKWIPSCSGFKVELGLFDWLYELFGLRVRPTNQQVTYYDWINTDSNRGLYYRFLKLKSYKDAGQMEDYWRLGIALMRSHAYQVSAFNYVVPNWTRTVKMYRVHQILREVKKLSETLSTKIEYRRVYIPKTTKFDKLDPTMTIKDMRPLGVPTVAWRVYLHMLANLIVWSREGKEGNQHGFTPGYGTGTAWCSILKRLDEAKYIYEFDLTNMFNEINLKYLRKECIHRYGYPVEVANWLHTMTQSIVKLYPATCEMGGRPLWAIKKWQLAGLEPDTSILINNDGSFNEGYSLIHALGEDYDGLESLGNEMSKEVSELYKEYEEYPKGVLPEPGKDVPDLGWTQEELENLREIRELIHKELEELKKEKGVPQGANISPILSNFSTNYMTVEKMVDSRGNLIETIMYADDGIRFGHSPEVSEGINRPEAGIAVAEAKSGWLKRDGIWQVDSFKFLGLRYWPATWWRPAYIEAATRKGATLRLSAKDYFLNYLLIRREQLMKTAIAREQYNIRDNSIAWEKLPEGCVHGYQSDLKGSVRIPESLRGWIGQEFYSFLAYPKKLNLIFNGRYRGLFMSWMYLDSRGISPPQDFKLKAVDQSWCKTRWAKFQLQYWRYLFPQDRSYNMQIEEKMKEYVKGLEEIENEDLLTWKMKNRVHKMKIGARKIMDQAISQDRIKLNIWNAGSFGCTDLLRNWPLEMNHYESVKLLRRNLFKKGKLTDSTKNKVQLLMATPGIFEETWKPLMRYYHEEPKQRSKTKKVRSEITKVKAKVVPLLSSMLWTPTQEGFYNFLYFLKHSYLSIIGSLTIKLENFVKILKVKVTKINLREILRNQMRKLIKWVTETCIAIGILLIGLYIFKSEEVAFEPEEDLRPYITEISTKASSSEVSLLWILLMVFGLGAILFLGWWLLVHKPSEIIKAQDEYIANLSQIIRDKIEEMDKLALAKKELSESLVTLKERSEDLMKMKGELTQQVIGKGSEISQLIKERNSLTETLGIVEGKSENLKRLTETLESTVKGLKETNMAQNSEMTLLKANKERMNGLLDRINEMLKGILDGKNLQEYPGTPSEYIEENLYELTKIKWLVEKSEGNTIRLQEFLNDTQMNLESLQERYEALMNFLRNKNHMSGNTLNRSLESTFTCPFEETYHRTKTLLDDLPYLDDTWTRTIQARFEEGLVERFYCATGDMENFHNRVHEVKEYVDNLFN